MGLTPEPDCRLPPSRLHVGSKPRVAVSPSWAYDQPLARGSEQRSRGDLLPALQQDWNLRPRVTGSLRMGSGGDRRPDPWAVRSQQDETGEGRVTANAAAFQR